MVTDDNIVKAIEYLDNALVPVKDRQIWPPIDDWTSEEKCSLIDLYEKVAKRKMKKMYK